MKVKDIIETTIIDDNHLGNGIAKKDNITIFVPKTVKDDKVKIQIEKINKKIASAKVLKILEKSKNHETITCPYYNECGGCNLLHISYEREKILKENYIKKLFNKQIKNITSLNRSKYRNKVTFHVAHNHLGFYKENTNELVEIKKCELLEENINSVIKDLNKIDLSNISEITIKSGLNGILINIKGKLKEKDLTILKNNKKIISIYQNNKLLYGDKYIKNKLGNIKYNINADSFFQINNNCTEKLYDRIKEQVKKADNLLDLYCGTGSIGLYLHDIAKNITGIEINKDSVKCAKENILDNDIKNYEIINSDASNIKGEYDTVIVDPPRSGLSKKVIKLLNESKADKIIYISCNPSTLKRDIDSLKEYNLNDIEVFNMFPATKHIETMCLLNIKKKEGNNNE